MSNALFPGSSNAGPLRGLTFTVLKRPAFDTLIQTSPNKSETRLRQTYNPFWKWQLIFNYLYDDDNNIAPGLVYTDLKTLMGFYLSRGGRFDSFLFRDPDDHFVGPGMISNPWLPSHGYITYAQGGGDSILDADDHWQECIQGGMSGAGPFPPVFDHTGGTTNDGGVIWQDKGVYPDGYPNNQAQLVVLPDGNGNFYSPLQRAMGGLTTDVTDPSRFWEDIPDVVILPSGLPDLAIYSYGVLQLPGLDYVFAGPGLSLPGYSFIGQYIKWASAPAMPFFITAAFNYNFRVRFDMDEQDFEKFMDELWTIGGDQGKQGKGSLDFVTSRPILSAAIPGFLARSPVGNNYGGTPNALVGVAQARPYKLANSSTDEAVVCDSGIMRYLLIDLPAGEPADDLLAIALSHNGLATSVAASIPASSGAGVYGDTTNSQRVLAGDTFKINLNKHGATPVVIAGIGLEFTPDGGGAIIGSDPALGTVPAATTQYRSLFGTLVQSEAGCQVPMPFPATFKTFWLRTKTAQGGGGDLVVNLRKNLAPTTALITVPASAPAGNFNDITHEVALAAGDLICLEEANGDAGAVSAQLINYMAQLTNANGSTALGGLANNQLSPFSTVYLRTFSSGATGTADEADYPLPRDGHLKNIYVVMVATAGGDGVTFTVQINGVDTALAVSIATGHSQQIISNIVDVVPVLQKQRFRVKAVDTGGAAISPLFYGWALEYAR